MHPRGGPSSQATMDAITDMADIFDGAAEFIEQLLSTQPGALSDADILKLYGFYKQATCGPCTVPKPGMFDFRGKAKWCVDNTY